MLWWLKLGPDSPQMIEYFWSYRTGGTLMGFLIISVLGRLMTTQCLPKIPVDQTIFITQHIYSTKGLQSKSKINAYREFPGSPVVSTKHFHCRGPGFKSLVRELRSHKLCGPAKKKKKTPRKKLYNCLIRMKRYLSHWLLGKLKLKPS